MQTLHLIATHGYIDAAAGEMVTEFVNESEDYVGDPRGVEVAHNAWNATEPLAVGREESGGSVAREVSDLQGRQRVELPSRVYRGHPPPTGERRVEMQSALVAIPRASGGHQAQKLAVVVGQDSFDRLDFGAK